MMNLIVLVVHSFLLGAYMVIWVIDTQERLSMVLYGLISLLCAAAAAIELLAKMEAP